jgi:hypothetical protein
MAAQTGQNAAQSAVQAGRKQMADQTGQRARVTAPERQSSLRSWLWWLWE